MRENIALCRGKRIDDGEWVEGWLVIKKDPVLETTYCFILAYGEGESFVTWYPVDPETVGECTGVKDKNGKRIFEGDVVKFGNIIGIINYNEGCYCVKTNKPDWRGRNNPAIDIVMNEYTNEIEIIGNIHDNPELLKGE